MTDAAVTTRHVLAGDSVRRGLATDTGPDLIADSFEGLPLRTFTFADTQRALHDTSFGENPNYQYLSGHDTGTIHGRALAHHLPGPFYDADDFGVSYQPRLSRPIDHCLMEYHVRFRDGFEWGGGGKLPGLGGNNSRLPFPPAGGAPSPHGFTSRFMWRADVGFGGDVPGAIELTSYLYLPTLPSDTFGIDRHYGVALGEQDGFSDGTWHHVKQAVKMNTTTADDSTVAAASLAQGVDYLADGVHEVWFDGERVYNKTDEVWRIYSDVHITRMHWSIFRGGADSSWSVDTPGDVDIAGLRVRELP